MSDRFRKEYRQLSDGEKSKLEEIKNAASAMAEVLENTPGLLTGREQALALTKLEECVMWAVKGVTK